MIKSQIEENRKSAFMHLVERKGQNKETIIAQGGEYSYVTQKGVVKKYIGFDSFRAYRNSELYPNMAERVNGFYFVLIQ